MNEPPERNNFETGKDYAFALANYWEERAGELLKERDEALRRLAYFFASHTHQWTDVTTMSDLTNHQQKHVCGCGETKITPL